MQFRFSRIGKDELLDLIQGWNAEGKPVVLDIETTGLDRFKDSLVSFQLCQAGALEAYYIDKEHIDALRFLSTPLVLHNFKFDFAFLLQQHGLDLRRVEMPDGTAARRASVTDTMLLHHLHDENAEHSLDSIVQERWGDAYKEIFWSRNKSFHEAPVAEQTDYACRDVVYTGLVYGSLDRDLRMSGVPDALVLHVNELALALYDTEVLGVRVDLDYLVKVGDALTEKISAAKLLMRAAAEDSVEALELAAWLKELDKRKTPRGRAGVKRPVFNWDSGPQLKNLVFGELKVPPIYAWDKKNKCKKLTLKDTALEEILHMHPLIPVLREYRGHQKVFGSFIQGTLERQLGGRIYPGFSVNGTPTGRISHHDPNVSQLPAEGGVRGIYAADPGKKFIGADYGMIEVVVAAHYSQDPALLSIIYDGASKHDITAKGMGVPRPTAKTLNFAIGYGATEFKVKQILNCSIDEAKGALRKYWETYAGEKKVIDECRAKVDRGEAIVGLYGRRRRFPKVFSSHREKEGVYRQAYNSLIQGSAADITHQAYYETSDYLGRSGYGRVVFEIHDQLLAESEESRAQEALDEMCRIMVGVGPKCGLSVPLTVDPQGPMDRWED